VQATPEGEVGRKGISCERTFAAISTPAELEAKARAPHVEGSHMGHEHCTGGRLDGCGGACIVTANRDDLELVLCCR
jgi:hypothetical protein